MVPNMAQCLEDLGWDIDVDGGSVSVRQLPDEQVDQYLADRDDCLATLGYDELPPPSFTADELARAYEVLLEVADCVRDLGHHVPDAPSRQAFIDQMLEHPIPQWHPYDGVVRDGDPGQIQQVEEHCPLQ